MQNCSKVEICFSSSIIDIKNNLKINRILFKRSFRMIGDAIKTIMITAHEQHRHLRVATILCKYSFF